MRPRSALNLGLFCAAALLAPSTHAQPAATSLAPASAASAPPWGHERVQRAPDPDVRFGHLPNGLRYAIQHNETPQGAVALRLHIAAGSMQERDDEQGLAHFLEHMAFRGSRNVPDGEVVRLLERQGLRLGPDTNAHTAHDQTVYQFNFPRADAAALDTGFTLLREIAERLNLDEKLVEQEKGVVLSEERLRDVPPQRAQQAELNNVLAGTPFATRWPIGLVATIQAATPERLRRYYLANYRPEKATLVVVGAIDVDAIERQIRERFGDWKSTGPADPAAEGTARPVKPAVEFVADGLADTLSLTWVSSADTRPPTRDVEREQFLAQLGIGVLNLRLSDRTLQPGSPFVFAAAIEQPSVVRLAGLTKIIVAAPAAQWREALNAVAAELRRLLEQGVQPADLQRLLPSTRSAYQAKAAQAATRQSAGIADALVAAANEGSLYSSAAQDLAEVETILDSVKAGDLTASLRAAFKGQGPVLFRAAKADAVGTEALAQQLAQALSRPLAAAAAFVAVTWPYTDFGAAGSVVERKRDVDLGSTTVRFANGTRLVVKPTTQEKDRIAVQVALGQGAIGLPLDKAHAKWALDALPLGGMGRLSLAEFAQWQQTSGKQLNVSLRTGTRAFFLSGNTRPDDLAAQLQVLAAQARDPGFRPEMGEKLAGYGPMMTSQIQANAAAVFQREFVRVVTGGDARLASTPSPADVAATRPEDVPALLRAALAGAADVFIVGDVKVDAAIAAVQSTFGAGPSRPRAPRLDVRVPAQTGGPHVVTHGGRADQALLGRVWSLPDGRADPSGAATAAVAAAIMQARLVDTVREQLGITYSPAAQAFASYDVDGLGYFAAQIETPPDKFDTFRSLLQTQLGVLADKPVGEDELQRARQPLLESRRKAPAFISHWLAWLPRVLDEPRMKALMLGEEDALQAVTAEQVQAWFRDRIVGRTPVDVVSRAR